MSLASSWLAVEEDTSSSDSSPLLGEEVLVQLLKLPFIAYVERVRPKTRRDDEIGLIRFAGLGFISRVGGSFSDIGLGGIFVLRELGRGNYVNANQL